MITNNFLMFWMRFLFLGIGSFSSFFSQFLDKLFFTTKITPEFFRQIPNSRKISRRKFFDALWTHLTNIVSRTQIFSSFVNLFIGMEQYLQKQISFHNFWYW